MTYNIKKIGMAAAFAIGSSFTPALAQEDAECDLDKPFNEFTQTDRDACSDNDEFKEVTEALTDDNELDDSDFTVAVYGKIDGNLSETVIDNLLEASEKDPDRLITMRFNSGGGSLVHAFAIYDVMTTIPNQISTVCEGQAASAAFMLLSAGAEGKRIAYPNCSLMAHQASGGAVGQIEDARISMEQFDELNEKMLVIIQNHTGWEQDTLTDMMSHNLYMTSEEAASLGFIDSVIEPKPLPEIEARNASDLPDDFCDQEGRENLRICYTP